MRAVHTVAALALCSFISAVGCAREPGERAGQPSAATVPQIVDAEPLRPATPVVEGAAATARTGASFVLADVDGHVGVVAPNGEATAVRNDGSEPHLSLDGTYAVSTVLVGSGDTKVAWDELPTMEMLGGTVLRGLDLVPSATQVGGYLTAFVDRPGEIAPGAIAAGRASTTVVLAEPDRGQIARFDLTGNLVAEAIGSTVDSNGLPQQLFMLEYLPAEAPARYRVRVLDTASGELAFPANLRDKLGPRVEQEMAGVTRGQVLADRHGLLFTLYRGTSDMWHGHPYAFVHTLDLFDGVRCLDLPAAMRLEELPGALAVAGDRLYVASANGVVGAFDIGDIREPEGAVDMLWVKRVGPVSGREPPAMGAGPDGAVIAFPAMSGLFHVAPDGSELDSTPFDDGTEAITVADGAIYAVGDTWMLPGQRPDWLGDVTRLVVLP